jgi:hypothetical protein
VILIFGELTIWLDIPFLALLCPSTVSRAKQAIKREQNITQCEALNIAARISVFLNYNHADRELQKVDIDGEGIREGLLCEPATLNERVVTVLHEDFNP